MKACVPEQFYTLYNLAIMLLCMLLVKGGEKHAPYVGRLIGWKYLTMEGNYKIKFPSFSNMFTFHIVKFLVSFLMKLSKIRPTLTLNSIVIHDSGFSGV